MQVTLLLGTTKGAFLLTGDPRRDKWAVSGPHCGGWPINHVIGDGQTLWAAGGGDWHGAGVWRSEDAGQTWDLALLANGQMDEWLTNDAGFAAMVGHGPAPDAAFKGQASAVWSLGTAGGVLYAGAKPGKLFRSHDRGRTWEGVETINSHAGREDWEPGAAGLVLHTIVADPGDPAKLWIGISAAGVFATEDGGASWERRNRLSNAGAAHVHVGAPPGHDHDTGLCVHNMVRAPGDGDVMYQQNHHGVFRSGDGGRSWDAISEGLPSTFGFPIAVDPADPATLWVLPLNGDSKGRYPPDASAAVWRSRDGGESWHDCRVGLPQANCYFTVLRQAMTVDRATPTGVYFGTNTGSVFASRDGGGAWAEIARHLPTVLSVETLTTP